LCPNLSQRKGAVFILFQRKRQKKAGFTKVSQRKTYLVSLPCLFLPFSKKKDEKG